MIEQITIHGYKSLLDVAVRFEPVTVLIGKSGTGKSNFLEAIRFLRDLLTSRNVQHVANERGGWNYLYTITGPVPRSISFSVIFRIEGITEAFVYDLSLKQPSQGGRPDASQPPQFISERLQFGAKTLFHHDSGKWMVPPDLTPLPAPNNILLGAITGFQESSLAYSALTNGLGCYRFSDRVLEKRNAGQENQSRGGLNDSGTNYVATFSGLYLDLQHWKSLKQIEAAMRTMKPSLVSVTVNQPQNDSIATAHEIPGYPRLAFDIGQESEGFRRLFVCLLALYQRPPKQSVFFDEPEKGIYTGALGLLAREFNACANSGRGQVVLTTHSPDFLDHFSPEQIRVVEMPKFDTCIGPVELGQVEAIKEQLLSTGDLLTVDLARINVSASPEAAQ